MSAPATFDAWREATDQLDFEDDGAQAKAAWDAGVAAERERLTIEERENVWYCENERAVAVKLAEEMIAGYQNYVTLFEGDVNRFKEVGQYAARVDALREFIRRLREEK